MTLALAVTLFTVRIVQVKTPAWVSSSFCIIILCLLALKQVGVSGGDIRNLFEMSGTSPREFGDMQ